MENNDIKSPLISTKNKSERNSSIELLRLLAMLLIVFNHWFVHGIGVDYSLFSLRETLCQMLGFLGCIGVDVYMLISGYYLINGHFHWSKFWSIIFQTIVISILWLLTDFLCVYFNYISWPDITNLNLAVFIIHSCLPFISNYWFIAGYLVIYLISPFLNKMIKALSKKDFGIFVLISTIVVTVISLITTNVFYSPLLILLNCYFIGSFLGLYFQDVNIKTVYVWMSLFISITLEVSSVIVMAYLGSKYSLFFKKNYYFVSQNSILILITSLSLFLLFRKKVFHSRVVNYISSAALTIYLLHDSSSRNLMWKLLGTSNLALDGSVSDGNILLNLLLSITIIFIAGLIFKIIEDTVILLFKKCVRIKDRNVC